MSNTSKKSDTVSQIQQAISNRNHSLIWVVDSMAESTYLIDPYEKNLPILYANPEFTNLTGYSREEAIGRRIPFLAGTATDPDTLNKIKEIITDEQSATVEMLAYRKDGTPFWKKLWLNPLYDDQEELVAYIGIQKKIAHKKTTEHAAHKTQQTCTAILDKHPICMSFINLNDINKNPTSEFPSYETIREYVSEYCPFLTSEEEEKLARAFQRALNGNLEKIHTSIRDVNQAVTALNILYVPSYADHKINGVHVIYQMIPEGDQSSNLLSNTKKYQTVRKMALSTVEAVNPPLAALKGFIQLSRLDGQPYADLMLTEVHRIEQIMTKFSLISQPRVIKLKQENLHTLLENMCTSLYTTALMKNINIDLTYYAKQEQIQCDRDNLSFVFIQLVENAMEAMPEGGTVTIEVTDKKHESLIVRVIDEGIGITEDAIDQVKQPFYTTKNNQLGLSLTICDNIMKEHQGSLNLIRKKNKGTLAEVVLPVN